MPWQYGKSDRSHYYPKNWTTLRLKILRRDPWCQLAYADICTKRSTDVDHIEHREDHSEKNLRGVCGACHRRRTAKQGNEARSRQRMLRRRRTESHPGRKK